MLWKEAAKKTFSSCFTQINNSCVVIIVFFFHPKNSSKINSEYYIATLKEGKQKAIKYYYMKIQ